MEVVKRTELKKRPLPGRTLQEAVGRQAAIASAGLTVGFATYSADSGPMEPHRHTEETIYVLDSVGGKVRYGGESGNLLHALKLEPGMILHFPAMEYHVFEYGEGGFVDIIYMYGTVDRIRPEDE